MFKTIAVLKVNVSWIKKNTELHLEKAKKHKKSIIELS